MIRYWVKRKRWLAIEWKGRDDWLLSEKGEMNGYWLKRKRWLTIEWKERDDWLLSEKEEMIGYWVKRKRWLAIEWNGLTFSVLSHSWRCSTGKLWILLILQIHREFRKLFIEFFLLGKNCLSFQFFQLIFTRLLFFNCCHGFVLYET